MFFFSGSFSNLLYRKRKRGEHARDKITLTDCTSRKKHRERAQGVVIGGVYSVCKLHLVKIHLIKNGAVSSHSLFASFFYIVFYNNLCRDLESQTVSLSSVIFRFFKCRENIKSCLIRWKVGYNFQSTI
jgi:hypothetical protein